METEKLMYRESIPCSRLFLRENKTREQSKEALILSDFYKTEQDIEDELNFIFNTSIENLQEEYKNKIFLYYKLGFVSRDDVPIL